jgi:hypothetical protein
MFILSFDPAIKNLGIVGIDFDVNYLNKINSAMRRCDEWLSDPSLDTIGGLITDIRNNIMACISIRMLNVIDLEPKKEKLNAHARQIDRTNRLMYLLRSLTEQHGRPDCVLIEYQMRANDTTRLLSSQIMMFYEQFNDIKYNFTAKNKKTSVGEKDIWYIADQFALRNNAIRADSVKCKIELIGCSIKNSFAIDEEHGMYSKFSEKAKTNKTANKAHTTHNLKYYLDRFERHIDHSRIKNKLNDIADAFMQAIGWIKTTSL